MVALQAEVKRVQTAADISADQTRTLLARKDQKQKEIDQYKVTLGEMEKQTNDKLTIGQFVAELILSVHTYMHTLKSYMIRFILYRNVLRLL